MKNIILIILLSLLMLTSAFANVTEIGDNPKTTNDSLTPNINSTTRTTYNFAGTGTVTDPYLINTIEHLNIISANNEL